MTRKRAVIAGALLVLVLTGLAAWFVFGRTDAPTARPEIPPAHSTATASAPLTAVSADQLASDLTSRDQAAYRSAWAHSNLPPMAPAGTTVVINVGTFKAQGGYGRADATVTLPGKGPEAWRLLLQFKNGHWLVYAMEEVK